MGILALLAVPMNLWLISRFRTRLRGISLGRAQRARRSDAHDRRAGARHPRREGLRPRRHRGRQGRTRVTEKAYRFSMTRARLLAGYDICLKMMPLLVQAGCAGARRAPHERRAASRSARSSSRSRSAPGSPDLHRSSTRSRARGSTSAARRTASPRCSRSERAPVTDGRMLPLPSTGLELRGVERRPREPARARRLRCRRSARATSSSCSGPPGSGKSTLAGDRVRAASSPERGVPRRSTASSSTTSTPRSCAGRSASSPRSRCSSRRRCARTCASARRTTIDDDTMLDALRTAGVDDVVDELDGGLDGYVGDRGLTLSGGQRQRVALARALVAQPRVLILDDALSAVNPSLEHEIIARIHAELPETVDPVHHPASRPACSSPTRSCSCRPAASMQTSTDDAAPTFATHRRSGNLLGGMASTRSNAVMAVEEAGRARRGVGGDRARHARARARRCRRPTLQLARVVQSLQGDHRDDQRADGRVRRRPSLRTSGR